MNGENMIAYKLFRKRKDGSLGSLFIGRRKKYHPGPTYFAQDIPTKGFTHRPGFHVVCNSPHAPHLTTKGRVWYKVEVTGVLFHERPKHQGGLWATCGMMRILEEVTP